MNRWFAVAVASLTVLTVLTASAPARALMARPFTPPQKVATADLVVVGKVVDLEEKQVEASPSPGAPQKVAYTIANIKIGEGLLGAKGVTNVRVGFVPTPAADPTVPVRPIRRPGMAVPNLAVGHEGCYFLTKHTDGDFYILTMMAPPMEKKAENFDKELALVRKFARILSDAPAALKSKDPKERLTAAGMLVQRHRAWRGANKMEPIDAEESKLILTVLLDADWTVNDPETFQSPMMVFNQIGLQPKDGFKYPQVAPGQDHNQVLQGSAKEWLKANAGSYRIKKYVSGK